MPLKIRYLSLFSGIEAFSRAVAGMPEYEPVAFAENDAFPSAVLKARYPDVPNLGDVTQIDGRRYHGSVDLLVGGSPCQGFSVAGFRRGLDDERSRLALAYVRLVKEVRAKWILWENVPGVLSSGGGHDYRSFCAALDRIGYSLAWTILDSQHFGVAQRRRRVFLAGRLGSDWRGPAKILLDPEGMCGDPPPRRKAGQEDAGGHAGGAGVRSGQERDAVGPEPDGGCATISAKWGKQAGGYAGDEYHNLVGEPAGGGRYLPRRITPAEAERLQGFPGWWTDIEFRGKRAPDSARYRAIGNSMTVNVMEWIARRLLAAEREEAAQAAPPAARHAGKEEDNGIHALS